MIPCRYLRIFKYSVFVYCFNVKQTCAALYHASYKNFVIKNVLESSLILQNLNLNTSSTRKFEKEI